MLSFYVRKVASVIKTAGPIFALRAAKYKVLSRLGVAQLMSLFLCPSHRCNANCIHCYEKFAANKGAGLSTAEVKDVLDQFKRLGGLVVHLCSGEFLLREDRMEIIRYISDNHMYASVTSNGLLLDDALLDELKDAGLRELVVSIDSSDGSRHDEFRGVKGCFEKATNGLRLARAKRINTAVWTYVSKTNFDALEGVVNLGKELGVEYTWVFFPLLSGHMFDKPEENLTFEEREAFRRQFNGRPEVRLEFAKESDICVGGGWNHVCVMPSGDVTFCPPVPYSYGNIRSRSLRACLKDIVRDHKRFCRSKCTGQCIVNFPEYRENCNATFMYDQQST
ncbi:MAG: radical SAM protein [Phycisphaerae bacterium]|nr:radical SAM protein [Phycisphaerae bacterium]